MFDDLEEDTRVLQGAVHRGDEVQQALQVISNAPGPVVTDEATPTESAFLYMDPGGPTTSPDGTGMGMEGATSPQIPVPRLATVPALRVAVMSAGVPGEVRLVPLDGGGPPPPGAVVAMLVPLTVADGDEVTKLFGFLV